MKNIIKTAVIASFFLLGAIIGQSQETRKPENFNTKFVIALFSADATVRALDGYTTVKLLNDPCRCYHESDPIAPKGGSIAAAAAFQAGALAAVYGGAWILNKHHHTKMARALLLIDIGSESYAVGRNMTRSKPVPVFGTPIQHISLQK
jgi:hypothetical protein